MDKNDSHLFFLKRLVGHMKALLKGWIRIFLSNPRAIAIVRNSLRPFPAVDEEIRVRTYLLKIKIFRSDLGLLAADKIQTTSVNVINKQKQHLVDVSELILRDVHTGIQRVVRNILQELLSNPTTGYMVEAVKIINYFLGNKSLFYLGKNLAIVKTIDRIKLLVNTRDLSIAPHILIDRQREPFITKFIRRTVKKGSRIIEIGSNIGYFTTIAANQFRPDGKVYAFELNPEAYKICINNIELNGLNKIVNIKNIAILDKKDNVKFQKFTRHQGNSTIVTADLLTEYSEEIELITVTTDALDQLPQSERIDFIKINPEARKRLIFSGMKAFLKTNNKIQILCDFLPERLIHAKVNPEEFIDYLSSLCFSILIINDESKTTRCFNDELLNKKFSEFFLQKNMAFDHA